MPRRFFRKFRIKRESRSDSRLLAPFRNLIHEPRLWGIRRRTVVPAVAIGLFLAWIPIPGHTIYAVLGALVLRINVAVAAVATLVANPLTMSFMYYGGYRLGRHLLDLDAVPFDFELSWDWISNQFLAIWQPLMLGTVLLGAASALISYLVLDVLWRLSLHEYKTKKREQRNRNSYIE